jgi:hypothetical protein
VQREPARLGGAVVPCPFGLRRDALQREHLLARSRADGNAIGDRMTDQVIERSCLCGLTA